MALAISWVLSSDGCGHRSPELHNYGVIAKLYGSFTMERGTSRDPCEFGHGSSLSLYFISEKTPIDWCFPR